MSVHEECGVFGVFAPKPVDAAQLCYYGLYALQHRGQESCGIVVNDDGVFVSRKDLGLVSEVFKSEDLLRFPEGAAAVGHVRYGTTGGNDRKNCQPIEVNHQKGRMAIAHNGNLSNAAELRSRLELSGAIFHTTSDTETIAYIVTRERLTAPSIEDAVSRAMNVLDGAYSLIVMSPQKLICVRDPYGFRPLCYGKTEDGIYIIASESCALKAVGASFIRDVAPGEMLVFSRIDEESSAAREKSSETEEKETEGKRMFVPAVRVDSRREHCGRKPQHSCVFEYIYFARPDSVIDGVSVCAARTLSGRILARIHPAEADIVIGVPDSGLDAALGFSEESGIPYRIGLIKNKYVGRTFIAPEGRLDQVRIKLSAVGEAVRGKRIVLIDDSIVRGTTSGRIVRLLREAGAKEIHMRISAPPFLHPCYYGTDIDSEEHLIACRATVEEIAQRIGADSLGYLPAEALPELAGISGSPVRAGLEADVYTAGAGQHCTGCAGICSACFDGRYPTPVPRDPRKDRFEKRLSELRKE